MLTADRPARVPSLEMTTMLPPGPRSHDVETPPARTPERGASSGSSDRVVVGCAAAPRPSTPRPSSQPPTPRPAAQPAASASGGRRPPSLYKILGALGATAAIGTGAGLWTGWQLQQSDEIDRQALRLKDQLFRLNAHEGRLGDHDARLTAHDAKLDGAGDEIDDRDAARSPEAAADDCVRLYDALDEATERSSRTLFDAAETTGDPCTPFERARVAAFVDAATRVAGLRNATRSLACEDLGAPPARRLQEASAASASAGIVVGVADPREHDPLVSLTSARAAAPTGDPSVVPKTRPLVAEAPGARDAASPESPRTAGRGGGPLGIDVDDDGFLRDGDRNATAVDRELRLRLVSEALGKARVDVDPRTRGDVEERLADATRRRVRLNLPPRFCA